MTIFISMTTCLFGLWLLLSGAAALLPLRWQIPARTGLLCAAPVLMALSLLLQGLFPASMVLCAIIVMEPGPLRWLIGQIRARVLPQAEPA